MTSRQRLTSQAIDERLSSLEGWAAGSEGLSRLYAFSDYPSAVSFVVRIALLAERHNHHPEIALGFERVRVTWLTHDVLGGGPAAITNLDFEMARRSDSASP